jgi:hypothetical protein
MEAVVEKVSVIEFQYAGRNCLAWVTPCYFHKSYTTFKIDFLRKEKTVFLKMNENAQWVETNNRSTKLSQTIGYKIELQFL